MGVQATLKDILSGFLTATQHTANNTIIEAAFDKALDRTANVNNAMAVNLDMGSNRSINVSDGVANTDGATVAQLNAAISSASSGLIAQAREIQLGSEASGQVFTLVGVVYVVGANNLEIDRNGVTLVKGVDYTETSPSSVTMIGSFNSTDRFVFKTNTATTNSVTTTAAVTHSRGGITHNLSTYLNNRVVSLRDFGATGDGVTDDTAALLSAVALGGNIVGHEGDTYLVSAEINLNVAKLRIDWKGSIIKAAPSLPNTDSIITVTALDITCENGEVDGNKTNIIASFPSGSTGNGVLVKDGGSGARILNMNTHDCITNGQGALSLTTALDDILFRDYVSKDNTFTGIGGEASATGIPITNIRFESGETSGNDLGGDLRIQGCTNFLVSNHNGHNSDHGGAVIGVGEGKNVTTGKIVNSNIGNDNIGIVTLDIDGIVGGSGPNAGQLETIDIELDNVTLTGNGGSTGLLAKNGAIVTGGVVTTSGHSFSLATQTDSIVGIDRFISKGSLSQALDIDSLVDLPHVTLENWGATSSACLFKAGSDGSIVKGAFGAATGETGKDGVSQVSSPVNIKLNIESFTGSGLSKGLIAGAIANTWEIKDQGFQNILEVEDGVLAPAAEVGRAKMYIDVADGDLKIIFGDGIIKTITTDT